MSRLARFALLSGLGEDGWRALAERLEPIRVEPGEVLFREGEAADALLLVQEGRVLLTSLQRRTRGEVGAGSALGALSLVVDGPREATARARSRCLVLRLTRRAFRALHDAEPRCAWALLEGLVRESAAFARDALAQLAVAPTSRASDGASAGGDDRRTPLVDRPGGSE